MEKKETKLYDAMSTLELAEARLKTAIEILNQTGFDPETLCEAAGALVQKGLFFAGVSREYLGSYTEGRGHSHGRSGERTNLPRSGREGGKVESRP